jgi:hypothetical protein
MNLQKKSGFPTYHIIKAKKRYTYYRIMATTILSQIKIEPKNAPMESSGAHGPRARTHWTSTTIAFYDTFY